MDKPKVKLTNTDGNAFAILTKCRKALKRAGYSDNEIEQFTNTATSGDYDYLLQVAHKWFNVE